MKESFFVYIALCANNSYYIGSTSNLLEREKQHNAGHGSRYTQRHRPVRIIYSEKFLTRKEAVKRELQLKGWSKIKKDRLIQGRHPNINK